MESEWRKYTCMFSCSISITSHLRCHLDEDLGELSVQASLLEHFTQKDGTSQGTHWSPAKRKKAELVEAMYIHVCKCIWKYMCIAH